MREDKKPYRYSVNKWKKIVDGYPESGLSVSTYCYKNGISDNSFYSWRKRFSVGDGKKSKSFIQVSGTDVRAGKPLCIQTPQGLRVEVPEGVDRNFLKDTLTVLAGLQ